MNQLEILKNKYLNMLSKLQNSDRVISTLDWPSFYRLTDDRFEILSVNDLLLKDRFYEIYRSYQFRNVFVPILIFGLKDEFDRVINLLAEKEIAKSFELKPNYFKYLLCHSERVDRLEVNSFQGWEDPLTYVSHKSACIYCWLSQKASANILRKDYDEYIHRESESEKALLHMKEIGLFEKQKTKYLKLLSRIPSPRHIIATEYWPFFVKEETPCHLLVINELLKAANYPSLLCNIFVPIVILGLRSELGRVINLLKEIGLTKKFELKPGFFKYLVKESDATSNRYADPISFFYSDRRASFGFSEGISITILLKDYDEYFLRRRNAEASLWGLQNYTCQYCGRIAEHIDHVVPLSKGGSCEHTILFYLVSDVI